MRRRLSVSRHPRPAGWAGLIIAVASTLVLAAYSVTGGSAALAATSRAPAGIPVLRHSLGAASAVTRSRPKEIPTGDTYIVTDYRTGRYLWYDGDKFGTFAGTYTRLTPTSGTSQEYKTENGECFTYAASNYVHEASCTGSSSQLWKSTEVQSNQVYILKVNSLGSGYCLQDMGSTDPVKMERCDNNTDQDWQWTVSFAKRRLHHRSTLGGLGPAGRMAG